MGGRTGDELLDGVTVHHPRFRHWPRMSQRRRAAVEKARAACGRLCEAGPAVIDAYLWPDESRPVSSRGSLAFPTR